MGPLPPPLASPLQKPILAKNWWSTVCPQGSSSFCLIHYFVLCIEWSFTKAYWLLYGKYKSISLYTDWFNRTPRKECISRTVAAKCRKTRLTKYYQSLCDVVCQKINICLWEDTYQIWSSFQNKLLWVIIRKALVHVVLDSLGAKLDCVLAVDYCQVMNVVS